MINIKTFGKIVAKLRGTLRKHYLAVIFAAVVGFLIIAPQLFFIFKLGANYQGIYMFYTDSEVHYLARIQDVYDGHGWGNPYLYEYKDSFPSAIPSISEAILAFPGRIFNISAANISLFYKFFLPLILYLLIYWFFYRLTKKRFWSLLVGLVILLGSSDVFSLPHFVRIFSWDQAYHLFAMYSRPVNPQFSSIFIWIYLHFFLSAIEKGKLKWFLPMAAVIGLSFYIYLYSWIFFLTATVVVAFVFLLLKKKDLFFKTLLAAGLGLVVGAPLILHLIKILQNQYYPILSVFDKMATHAPNISKMGILVTIIFLVYFFFWSKKNQIDYFLLGLLATTFIVTNQQLVTGHQLQPGHFYFNFNTPVFIMALFWMGHNLSQKFGFRYFAGAAMVLVILSFATVILIQQSTYNNDFDLAASQQKYMPVLKWLDSNSQVDDVAVANEELSTLIPIYTHDNVYWENSLVCYIVPPERFLASFFLYLKLGKVAPGDFGKKNFNDYGGQISLVYADVLIVNQITDLGNLGAEYRDYYNQSFADNLKEYRTNYIVWDKDKNPIWQLDQYSNLQEVYNFNNFAVYKVI